MQTAPDQEMEKLLCEVRKTISDNEQFLKGLLDDSDDTDSGQEEDIAEGAKEEEFEEL